MPLTPSVHANSCTTLPAFFLHHEFIWNEILKYISPSDLDSCT